MRNLYTFLAPPQKYVLFVPIFIPDQQVTIQHSYQVTEVPTLAPPIYELPVRVMYAVWSPI